MLLPPRVEHDEEALRLAILYVHRRRSVAGVSCDGGELARASAHVSSSCSLFLWSQVLDVALGTACSPSLGAIVHANDPSCRSRLPPPPAPCSCGVSCSFAISGMSVSALQSDPSVSGAVAYAIAQCASGNCAAGTAADVSISPSVTAADVTIANATDPSVPFEGGSGGGSLRRSLRVGLGELSLEKPASQRRLRKSSGGEGGGLSFTRPGGSGLAQPVSINPAAPAFSSTPRRLDWYSESLATTYVPPTPAVDGIPVTTRNAAAGYLGIGTTQVWPSA